MDPHPRHEKVRYKKKLPNLKVNKTKSERIGFEDSEEVKILNTEQSILELPSVQSSQFFSAACEFETALKTLQVGENEDVYKRLQKIQNMIKQKISKLKQHSRQKVTDSGSVISLSSKQSVHSSNMLKNVDLVKNLSSSFKSMALSTESLCLIGSTKSKDLDDEETFQKFLKNVNCPFCMKTEDKFSLIKHLDENCLALTKKTFDQNNHIPYSVFQILPNSTFKCNICPNSVQSSLNNLFIHSRSERHLQAYKTASSRKSFEMDLLFCACCKVQIPINATQINFHINHETHKTQSKNLPDTHSLSRRGIEGVYTKDKRFKCLVCPEKPSTHQSIEEILEHFMSMGHYCSRRARRSRSIVYCALCSLEVEINKFYNHCHEALHIDKEKNEVPEASYELCFYCGFKCANLPELSSHMRSQCEVANSIRKSNIQDALNSKNATEHEHLKNIPGKDKSETNTGTTESRCIVVQGYNNLSELASYFEKYGEITFMEWKENGILIKFGELKPIQDISPLRKITRINGVKVNIIVKNIEDSETDEESVKESSAKRNTKIESLADSSKSEGSSSSDEDISNDDSKKFNSTSNFQGIFSNNAEDSENIENLFKRAAAHLQNATVKLDPKESENIINDCQNVLKFGKCHHVGFSACELTFLKEEITFYCEIQDDLLKKSSFDSACLSELELFNKHLAQICKALLSRSVLFERIMVSNTPIPSVKFYHKNTKNKCRIIFRESFKLLSDMLSHCLSYRIEIRSFVLLTRLWLTVHELEIRKFEDAVISLLVFFLVSQEGTGLPFIELNERNLFLESKLSSSLRQTAGEAQRCESLRGQRSGTVREMFKNFLLFLNNFDFEENAICLPHAEPVPKAMLLETSLSRLICNSGLEQNEMPPLWIMDPLLCNNLSSEVTKRDLDSLLKIVHETVGH